MSMRRKLAMGLAVALSAGVAGATDAPRFGQPIGPNDLAPWDISVGPDGGGLPAGSGTPAQGRPSMPSADARSAMARGAAAVQAVRWSAAGRSIPADRDPVKLIGNYWPYATTIFDYTRRAMPWNQPKTLTNDEVYALTAYISRSQQDHRRKRCDERGDFAEGADAQPRWVHQQVSGKTLTRLRIGGESLTPPIVAYHE